MHYRFAKHRGLYSDNEEVGTGRSGGGGRSSSSELCTYGNDFDKSQVALAPTPLCSSPQQYGKYGIPGGAVCQGAEDLAQCPRPWQ